MSAYFIESKLPGVGETIFTVMSSLAQKHNAVNLGQGFPDFPMSEELVALTAKAMKDGYNQYTHMNGYPGLREILSGKIKSLYRSNVDQNSQITVTPGGTYAIYTALTAVLQPRDEVILFEPAYDSYIPNITINGAVPVCIPLEFPEYRINWNEVRANITPRTRMIMLNSPHNPTGSVLTQDDLRELSEIVKDTRIIILSDEVYEHIIFDNIPHQSILLYPDLLERSFVCFSFGKVFHCTGWKLGYCVSGEELMKEFRKVHQFNCFTCNTPAQVAIAEYLKDPSHYNNLGRMLQQKRDAFEQMMIQNTLFTPLASHGSYFQCYRYNRISSEPDTEFAIRLTRDYGVASIPVSAFYHSGKDEGVIRFCFAKKMETLERAVAALGKVDVR